MVEERTADGPGRRLRVAALPPGVPEEMVTLLGGAGLEVVVPPTRDQDGVRRALEGADIVLGDWSGGMRLGAGEAAAAGSVAYIQQPGVGVESIDLAAWAAAGVPVAVATGANAASVAEWCVGSALTMLRSMPWADAEVRAGRWPQLEIARRGCRELAAQRVGILGFGDIGSGCATRFAAFGCEVAYWTRRRRRPEEERGAVYRELDDLLRSSDVLVVVIALGEQTRGLLDAARLALLPPSAVIVNAARGGLVDEQALVEALAGGALGGAALDVFASEPLAPDSPLRSSDRVLLSPHVAGATTESRARILSMIGANLVRAMRGEPLVGVVNGAPPLVRWRA
jgi:D-3-phosphoglycerate dehydrogenase / 2-oxoglutarate reductase